MFASRLVPAALLFGLALTASASAQQPAANQTVVLYSYGYTPRHIVLAAGAPVTLRFYNRSGKGHNFVARSFFASSRIVAGKVSDGEVEVAPGTTRAVTLVPAAGTYRVRCTHPFHTMLGMRGEVVVR